jgi:hypothetical protein
MTYNEKLRILKKVHLAMCVLGAIVAIVVLFFAIKHTLALKNHVPHDSFCNKP